MWLLRVRLITNIRGCRLYYSWGSCVIHAVVVRSAAAEGDDMKPEKTQMNKIEGDDSSAEPVDEACCWCSDQISEVTKQNLLKYQFKVPVLFTFTLLQVRGKY